MIVRKYCVIFQHLQLRHLQDAYIHMFYSVNQEFTLINFRHLVFLMRGHISFEKNRNELIPMTIIDDSWQGYFTGVL